MITTFIQTLINGILEGSVYAIVALGFSLIYRITGVINLSQGAFSIFGALVMFTLNQTLGWPPVASGIAAVGATAILAAILGATAFVPSLSRLPASSMLMITVGLLGVINGLILIFWGNTPYTLPQFSGEKPVKLLGLTIVTQAFWLFGATALIIVFLYFLLSRTPAGNALRACSENAGAARLMGIDVPRMTLISFSLAAVIAGIGGIFFGPVTSFQYDTGSTITNAGFIAAVIGGMGTSGGAILGGFAVGILDQLASGYVSTLFSQALTLAVVLITLLWRPTGLFFRGVLRRMDVREGQRIYHRAPRLAPRTKIVTSFVCACLIVVLPFIIEDDLLRAMVITGILFIAVLGLDVLMGYTGQVSLGQNGFMAIGGYTAGILSATFGVTPLLAIAAAMVLSIACAALLSFVTVRLSGIYLALATLSFGLLIDSLTAGLQITGGPSGLVGVPSMSIGSFEFDSPISMYYLVAGIAATLVLVLYGGIHSSFGRTLQAIRTDQLAATALGINVKRYRAAVFCVSAALASLAGSLYAYFFHFLSPDMVNIQRSFEMITMMILGGEATLVGSVFGSAVLTMLPIVFQPLAQFKIFFEGLLLILVFRYMPGGLYGVIVDTLLRLRRLVLGCGSDALTPAGGRR